MTDYIQRVPPGWFGPRLGQDWPDVWAEYRRTFDRLKLDEGQARTLVMSAVRTARTLGIVADPDSVADALKEFVVLDEDRNGEAADVRAHLAMAISRLNSNISSDVQRAEAVAYFGVAGERLHRVLAELRIGGQPKTSDLSTHVEQAGTKIHGARPVRPR